MKTELFNDLYACITEGIPEDTITEPEFLYYIIGYNSKNYKNHISYDKLSEKIVRRLLKGTVTLYSIFANEYFYILEMSKELKLDDFFYLHLKNNPPAARKVRENITCKDQILSLYNMHQLCIPPKKKTEELLINLFTACIMENVNFFSSYIKTLPKPDTLKSILGRENDAYILKDKIKQHHKIIISAQHGMGKTAFIKYCLSSWKLQDFCYISYKDDLDTTLEGIKYTKNFKRKYFQKFDNLIRETKPNSLLVIDNMQYSKNFDHDLEELANLPINVIVILPNSVSITSFYNFKLSPLSDDLLKEIFKSFSNYFFIENSFWDKLFFVTQKNILIISLIAQQCRIIHSKTHEKSSASMKTISNNILSRLTTLERDESGKNPSPFSLYKFKHIYDSKTLDIIGHAKLIYKTLSNEINMSLKGFLEHLCLFGLEPVPYDFLSIIVPSFSKEKLDKLSEMSFLVLLDETVQLNPLFCHLIIAETKPSPEQYVLIIDRLTNFLENYDKELSIPYLSDILFTFIQLLYPHVKRINNPSQKSTSSIFNKWQDLLYLTVYYYHQCGNFQVAEKITSMIKYPDLISFHNSLDRSLLLLENSIHSEYDPENISEKLQEIEKSVTTKTPDIQQLHFHLSCITQCNYMTTFYCYLQVKRISGNNSILNRLNDLQSLMFYHLYSSTSYMKHEFTSFSNEQINYFRRSNSMMFEFSSENNYLKNVLYFTYNFLYFEKFREMNPRINGMAFTIFLCSLSLFTKLDYRFEPMIKDTIILNFFKVYIVPMIRALQDQLKDCKLIPRETFRLCIFAHTIVSEIQRYCLSLVSEKDKISIREMYNIRTIESFLDCVYLSEEEKNAFIRMIVKFIV